MVKRGTLHNLTTDSCEYIQNVDNSHSTDIGDTWNVGNTHNTHRGEEGNLNNSPNTQIVVMIASGQYSQHAHTHTHSGEDRQMDTTQHIAGLEVKETRVETQYTTCCTTETESSQQPTANSANGTVLFREDNAILGMH